MTPIAPNAQFPIPDNAPPVFMVCATDDPSHVVPTVKFYLELQAHHVPAEMHIYDYGEHGFGLRPTKKPGSPVEAGPRASANGWQRAEFRNSGRLFKDERGKPYPERRYPSRAARRRAAAQRAA